MKIEEAHELWEDGKLEDALKVLYEIDNPDIDILQDIGLIHLELFNIEEASEVFNDIITINPDFAGGYYGLAICMDEIGDTEEALTYYLKTIMIDPKHVSAYIAIGDIFAINKSEEAIKYYDVAGTLSPTYWLPVSSIGDYYQSIDEHSTAIDYYLEALDIEENFWSYHGLGYCYNKTGEVESAISAYKSGLLLNDYPYTIFNLAVIYKDISKYEESLEMYNKAIEIHEDVVFYYNRGCLYNLMGNIDLAKKDLLYSITKSENLKKFSVEDSELINLKEWLLSQ